MPHFPGFADARDRRVGAHFIELTADVTDEPAPPVTGTGLPEDDEFAQSLVALATKVHETLRAEQLGASDIAKAIDWWAPAAAITAAWEVNRLERELK